MKDEGIERFGGTKDIAETHKFDQAKLEQYALAHVEGFEGPLEVRQFKGGQSNPTYQLITPNKKYVMRRKPPGKLLPSAHAVDREWRVVVVCRWGGAAADRVAVFQGTDRARAAEPAKHRVETCAARSAERHDPQQQPVGPRQRRGRRRTARPLPARLPGR